MEETKTRNLNYQSKVVRFRNFGDLLVLFVLDPSQTTTRPLAEEAYKCCASWEYVRL